MNTKIKTDERIRRLVLALGQGALPRRELIADLGLQQNARRNFRDNYLKPAAAKAYIRMLFPECPSSPDQAYRLTQKGMDFLEELRSELDSQD